MLTMLQNWAGAVEVNGKQYDNIANVSKPDTAEIHIVLHPVNKSVRQDKETGVVDDGNGADGRVNYRITVKKYMTKKASPDFDFMLKWNEDVPMPLRTMTGYIDKETRGMYHMVLHGDIWAEKITTCMCCGRTLTNPVSQYFGIGPECGGHNYVNPFDSEEELRAAVDAYRKQLQETVWTGWVIKSAVTSMEAV